MNLSILKQKKILFPSIGILILVVILVVVFVLQATSKADKEENVPKKREAFEDALKINGKFVDAGIFRREGQAFFKRYSTNSDYLRMTDEERNDIFIDQVIERMVIQVYVEKNANQEITQDEVDDYIEKEIKSNFPDEEQYKQYLQMNGFDDEKDLSREIKFYLQRLQCLPDIARKMGIKLDDNDKKRLEDSKKLTEDSIIVSKFLESEQLKEWIKEIKEDVKIEIVSPAILAYRYYKEGDYKKAEEYYRKAYEKFKTEDYLKRAEECKEKMK